MGRRARRDCPACGVPVARPARGTAARWCGACGAPLKEAAGADGAEASDGAAAHVRRPSPTRWMAPAAAAGLCLVVVGTAVGGATLDRLAPSPAASLDVDLGRDRIAAATDDRAGADGPVCLRDPACVVWVEQASVAGRVPTATLADDLTLVRVRDALEARTTEDGHLRWHLPLDTHPRLGGHLPVLTAGGLALVTTNVDGDAALLGVDLATGTPRWHLPGVGELEDAQAHDGVLLVQVQRIGAGRSEAGRSDASHPGEPQVVAIDPDSGAVRWSAASDLLHLLTDGAVVVSDGEVTVLDSAGDAVWTRALDDGVEPAWLGVTGRFLRVYDAHGRSGPHLAVADGAPFDLDGELVPVADLLGEPRAPFHRDLAALVTRRTDGATDLSLVDGDVVAWRVTLAQLGCCAPIQLDGDRIVVPAADGGRWALARSDGTELERAGPPPDGPGRPTALPSYGGVTVEEANVATARADLVLIDDRERTARLPAGSWPVGATDDIVVIRSPSWVAAIRRDADRDDS